MSDVIEETKPAPTATAGVINQITINMPPAAKAANAGVAVAKKSPLVSLPIVPKQGPRILDTVWDDLNLSTPKREVYYDANGVVKHTRYTASNGATAVLREDPKDHNAVTLTLTDKNGTLVTQGNARGFQAASSEGRAQSAEPWRVLYDTLTCPAGKKQITTNETESITREKLQQFAEDHPQLARALRGVELPVTVVGELPVSFAKAVDTPTQYRACPENRSGIVIERLTEKSAPRK